mmetsp:Transcript_26475/g.56741  ORF Transcript_26475/g.56741 Transcript_26475/m.56741 type:complete len:330 (+) Transcript_26475:237-1226(+)|eukprot:CAMPEP_0201124526 /NCGR_PEP_ID=MMETSP0850-20130426/14588_1 /ASSEMBLY_ACC=CAM_ASM_000622 /TAXON_ID=183588 /ORGANISM="Pseudo-nitzschia fraudulenta, Strain WWA7" /LENGTH=329 /DNA_ID=CAMNT_0047391973 /DNA_START=62 /DNA_END=1051 /DNA_ORIENTATION=+
MKYCVAAILALSAAPAHSFSYLESLGAATPVASSVDIAPPAPAAPAEEAPFYFTNGATDEPADSPAFYFTSGSEDVPAATTSGSYLDALGGASAAPTAPEVASGAAGSSSSYLNVLGNGATSVSGPGITNYLDALPQNSAIHGAGISTYASSLNQYASEIIASTAPDVAAPEPVAAAPAAPAAPVAPVADVGAGAEATTSGSYLDALSTAASQTSGAGIATYVESLPITAALAGGAGINTYASNLVAASVVSGPGVPTYADSLGGGIASFTNSFSPFGGDSIPASGSQVTFTMGSVTGQFDFSLEADAEMVQKLKAAGSNSVTITGTFY